MFSKHDTSDKNFPQEKNIESTAESAVALGNGSDVCPGSADVVSPQTLISCGGQIVNPVLSSGIDTLVLTLSGQVDSEVIERLRESKKDVQSGDSAEAPFKFGSSDLFSWNLQRNGSKLYPFILKNADVTLMLSARSSDSRFPAMQLHIGSITCQTCLDDTLGRVYMWMDYHKFLITEEKVSRIDLNLDLESKMDGLGFDVQGRHISRADHFAVYYFRRQLTGIQVGRSDIVMRGYNKLQELAIKKSMEKYEAFRDIVWAHVPENVFRLEFQLRRRAIVDFFKGKTDFKTIQKRLGDLWEYLTNDWFLLCEKEVDRENNNQSKAKVSKFWQIIQKGYSVITKKSLKRRKKNKHINIPALVDQAAGCLYSVLAGMDITPENEFIVLGSVSRIIQDKFLEMMSNPKEWLKEYTIRQRRAVLSF